MEQALELQKIFTDTLSHTEINEQTIHALKRQTFTVQDKITAVIQKDDSRIDLQKIRTYKFVNDNSTIFKDTNKVVNQVKQQEKLVVKALNDVNKNYKDIAETTKTISNSIDALSQGMGLLTNLSYLNVALGAANLCATLVTFAIMNEKLDSIQCGVDEINKKLDQMMKAKEIDTAIDIKKLVSRYRHMLDNEEKGIIKSLDEYRQLLVDIYMQDSKLLNYYLKKAANNQDEILSAIYLLSGMLAQIIKKYDEMYYFRYKNEKHTVDPEHDDWMSIFETLSSQQFLDIVSNYCFFNENMSNRKTQGIISNLYYSQINSMVMIEDNNLIAQQCENADELKALRKEVNQLAYKSLCEQIENSYEQKELEYVVSKEEMQQKTREAAIRLGYITA